MGNAIRWTPEALAEYERRTKRLETGGQVAQVVEKKAAKRSKYASKKVTDADGITHDSGKEARRWAQLQAMEKAGEISDLKRQVPFVLAPAVRLLGEHRMKPALRYFADAVYVQNGEQVVEDVKSRPTRKKEGYRIKKHLMATVHNIQIKEL